MEQRAETPPILVPWQELSPETLHGVIEAFVLREGTEYGSRDFTLAEKVAAVRTQLERGEVQILFFPEDESCLITARER